MNSHCSVCKSLARRLKMFDNMETHMKSVSTKGRTSHFGGERRLGQGGRFFSLKSTRSIRSASSSSNCRENQHLLEHFIGKSCNFFWKGKIHTCRPLASDLNVSRLTNWNVFLSNVRCADSLRTQRLYFWHTNGKSYFQMEIFAIVPLALISNVCANVFTSGVDIKCLRKYFHLWYWYQMFAQIFAPVVLINQMFAQIFSTSGIDIKCVHKCFHLCCWYQIFAQIFSPLVLISNVCTNISTSGIDIKCLRKCFHLWWSGSEAGDGIGCLKLEPAADSKVAKTFKVASPRERF